MPKLERCSNGSTTRKFERYVSQVQQKLDRDLRTLVESKQPFDDVLQLIAEERPLEILPQEFVGRAIQHPLFSMTRWYLKSQGAICLATGLSLRKNMGNKYQLELDHIFPFSKLKARGYGTENRLKYALAQEFTNRALLTQVANRSKSASDPAVYLAEVMEKFPMALNKQSIPTDKSLWTLGKILAKGFNDFLNDITNTDAASPPATIEDLIAEGESDELEFKSTLRWDIKEGKPSKILEDVIVKAVAAFANVDGGTLIIGVSDEAEILGLVQDFQTLKEPDRDHFELHLRNPLDQNIGKVFATNKVQVKFHTVYDLDVCQVDIAPSKEPIILITNDKNGHKVEKFYVRSGNASQELSMTEFSAYAKDHFHAPTTINLL
jgi:hypothetical protein